MTSAPGEVTISVGPINPNLGFVVSILMRSGKKQYHAY